MGEIGKKRFLHNVHGIADENLASFAYISRQIRTQSKTYW